MDMIKIIFSLFFLLAACQNDSTSTGNPVTVELKVTASSQPANVAQLYQPFLLNLLVNKAYALPPPSLVDAGGRTVTLSSVWIVLKQIEFQGESSGAGNSNVKYNGPFAVDLLSSAPQSFGQALIVPPIRRFRAVLHKMDFSEPSAPAGLAGYAIYISGSVGGNSFIMRSDEGVTYEVGGPNALYPNEGSMMLLGLFTGNLFKRIDLGAITNGVTIDNSNKVSATNPCPNINSSASELYTCFKDGLRSEANLGIDSGNDNELDNGDNKVK
jgi:hypothetical protein